MIDFLFRGRDVDSLIRTYCELETKLLELTGCNMEQLVELFAAGYTLQSPKYTSFEDLEKEAE